MSTRCQVKIKEHGSISSKDQVTLYHHCDGYPTAMIPLIAAAYKPDWKHGRFGKVVSFVIAEDPEGYEVEQGHAMHGDIEWYYILEVKSKQDVSAIPQWILNVYKIDGEVTGKLSECSKKVFTGSIDRAVILAEQIEGA